MKISKLIKFLATSLVMVTQLAFLPTAQADRIKDISNIAGQRPNQLVGYGLVVGLDGTGDLTTQTPFTLQSVTAMLSALGVTIPPGQSQTQLRNVAAVMVTAELPALGRPGQQMDVTVSAMGNSRSLKGGTLLMTPLRAADGQVYAQAQGSLVVSGAGATTQNARVSINHLSAGRIPSGALIERSTPTAAPSEFVQIDLKSSDFSLMQRTADAIVRRFGRGTVMPLDARSLNVRVPTEPMSRIAFMAELQELDVRTVPDSAKVVLNSRTGSVVMNQSVKLAPFAVAHGNLSIRVNQAPNVSQPGPFSGGRTAITSNDTITIDQGKGGLSYSAGSASLENVVRALNMLGASPQDLMAILQAMKASGALKADLEVI
jgi:flagellar P-ring protein precursor FlgI